MRNGGLRKLDEDLGRNEIELVEPETKYVVYKARWLVLISIVTINMGCFMIAVSLSPVATSATKYYDINGDELDLIPIVSCGINIPGLWLALYLIGRFKLLKSIRIASTIITVGAIIRALSTMPIGAYNDAVPKKVQFGITFAGQLIIALGHPMLMTMSTKISQVWFAEQERMISTPVLALAPLFGAILGQGISPRIVQDDPSKIAFLNIATIFLVVIGTIFSWIFLKTAGPLTPPSRSAALLMDQPPMTLKEVFINAKKVIANPTVLLIGVCYGGGGGLSSTVLTQLNQLMCSRNYTTDESSNAAMVNLIVGFSGAVILSLVAKRIGKTQEMAKVCYAISSLFVILFSINVIRYGSFTLICIGLAGFGFFGFSAYPMALELAAEVTYPIDAAISESWVHVNVQIGSIFLIFTGNKLFWDFPSETDGTCNVNGSNAEDSNGVDARDYTPYSYLIIGQVTLTTLIVILFLRGELLRTAEDHKETKKISQKVSYDLDTWTSL